jgi:hypothetical protein
VDSFASQAIPTLRTSTQSLPDAGLTAYELLRRLISGRSPFSDWLPQPGGIPEDLEGGFEFAVQSYQLYVFLDLAGSRYGSTVSGSVRDNLLLLSGFDQSAGSRLPALFQAFKAAGAIYDPNFDQLSVDNPEVQFHIGLASAVMYVSDWPEEGKAAVLMPLAECLNRGLYLARELFTKELDATTGIADGFTWSDVPGPFERQLQRQRDNPLFPAMARAVSPQQVVDARKEDLRHAFKFLRSYRRHVKEGLSFAGKILSIKDASSFLHAGVDLLETCSVLGAYFSPEQKALEAASEATLQEILKVTNEPALKDLHEQYLALSRLNGFWKRVRIALPHGVDTEEYCLRSILSEDIESISNYATLCGGFGWVNQVDLARKIVGEAIRDGMDSDVARAKLGAFGAGMHARRTEPRSGRWSAVKRFFLRSS